jgi:XTP/dITP diphosphohydrolase
MNLLVASFNEGKAREYRKLLAPLQVTAVSLRGAGVQFEVPETGSTYNGNALLKARGYSLATNMWALADDSGLEVDALGGAPGVHSSRYAGVNATDENNVTLLLKNMSGIPLQRRSARFRCVIALASPLGGTWTFEGCCHGYIALEPRGEYGFGYDPVFILPNLGQTMAEIVPEIKDQISHRAVAASNLRSFFWYLITH